MTKQAPDPRLVEIDFLMDLERNAQLTLAGRRETHFSTRDFCDMCTGLGVRDEKAQVHLYGTDPRRFRDMVHDMLIGQLITRIEDGWPQESINGIPRGLPPGADILVQCTHAGRVHLWNMRDALLRNRIKDPTGILFDGRNAERDLQIALWAASEQDPLAVAFVDMNGLKAINDTVGHHAGDEAVRAYFEVIAAVIGEVGDAYRVGGDEVVVILPKKSLADGAKLLGLILRNLNSQAVVREGQRFQLSACAGITAATNPGETAKAVRARADAVQYKAKKKATEQTARRFGNAKKRSGLAARRLGALAVDGVREIEEFLPADAPKPQPKRNAR